MTYNPSMLNQTAKPRKTYFGFAALAAGIFTDLFLGANIGVSYLRITPETFNQLNYLTALLYCSFTPLTFTLGVVGHVLKNDSKISSRIAIILVTIPFLVLFTQLIFSIRR